MEIVETLTGREIKERLRERGLSVSALAREAGIEASNMNAMLNGHQYCGEVRRARIEGALLRLRLDKDHCREPEVPATPVFRIRRL